MFEDLPLFAVHAEDPGEDDARAGRPGAMRKTGGIIGGQLSDAFLALEARFMAETEVCVLCGGSERATGRLHCEECQVAQRPAPLSPAQRQAAKERVIAIGRARVREGLKAGRFDLCG